MGTDLLNRGSICHNPSVEELTVEPIDTWFGNNVLSYTIEEFERDVAHCLEFARYAYEQIPVFGPVVIAGGCFQRIISDEPGETDVGDIDLWPVMKDYYMPDFVNHVVEICTDQFQTYFKESYLSWLTLREHQIHQIGMFQAPRGHHSTCHGFSFMVDDLYPLSTVNLIVDPVIVKPTLVQTIDNFDFMHTRVAYWPDQDQIVSSPLAMMCAKRRYLVDNTNGVDIPAYRRQKFMNRGFQHCLVL
jgi:hypothetical protein